MECKYDMADIVINDLGSFLEYLGKKHRRRIIKQDVSRDLEITEFSDRACREHPNKAPAMVFEDVSGFDSPVATNILASSETLSELFGTERITGLLATLSSNGENLRIFDAARALISAKPKTMGFNGKKYTRIGGFDELPILKVWPNDAGRYITQPIVVTCDPEDGSLNAGIYRMQVFDNESAGMHWQAQKGGAMHFGKLKEGDMKVTVALGTDPYNLLSAITPLPEGVNEFSAAGILRGNRSLLVGNGKYPPAPANAETLLFGSVSKGDNAIEGPFGDHTGYYSIPQEYPVFRLEAAYSKKNAIYPASVVGFPWNEDATIGLFLTELLKPVLKSMNKCITDIYLPPEGLFTSTCFVSINKRVPGEAKKAMFSLLGFGQLSFIKIMAVFDDDIDIRDSKKVLWALSSRVEPERDIQIIRGTPLDSLDHSSGTVNFGSKVLIDATKKGKEEGYYRDWPDVISMSEDIKRRVDKKWNSATY